MIISFLLSFTLVSRLFGRFFGPPAFHFSSLCFHHSSLTLMRGLSLSPSRFQSSSSPNERHDFPPPTFAALPPPAFRAAQLPLFLPLTPRSWDPSPYAYTRRPKLESNFPHHIPQKLLRGCSAGQEATRRTALARRNDGTFLSSLCLPLASFFFFLSLFPPPSCRPK